MWKEIKIAKLKGKTKPKHTRNKCIIINHKYFEETGGRLTTRGRNSNTHLSIHLSIHLFIHLFIYLLIHQSIDPLIDPSIHRSIHPSIRGSIHRSIHPSIRHNPKQKVNQGDATTMSTALKNVKPKRFI